MFPSAIRAVTCSCSVVDDFSHMNEMYAEVKKLVSYLEGLRFKATVYKASIDFRVNAMDKLFGVLVMAKKKKNCTHPYRQYIDILSDLSGYKILFSDVSLCKYKEVPKGSP